MGKDNNIQAKISLPITYTSVIRISDFIQSIERVYEGKTVFISAPAGFGKTTNIAFWIQSNTIPCAWVSLDENDDSPNRFVKCLIYSISKQLDQKKKSLLELDGDAETLMESLLINLYNIKDTIALVLDDFHHIKKKEILSMLSRLIKSKPKNIYLIISGRAPFPKEFFGVLTRQAVEVVTKNALVFKDSDIRLFFERRRISVSEQQIAQCVNITQGWALGLVAMSLVMSSEQQIKEITSESVSVYTHQFMFEEIWLLLDNKTREFLGKTSILDEFSVPLARAVTGMDESREILTELYEKGAFINRFGNKGDWYRYHHVFKKFLVDQARIYGYDLSKLNNIAAKYYRQKKHINKALKHYELSGNKSEIMNLVKENMADFLRALEPKKIVEVIEGLENYGAFSDIDICVCYEWALQQIRNPAKAQRFINTIEKNYKEQLSDMSEPRIKQIELEISAMNFPFMTVEKDINKIIECLNNMYLLEVKNPIVYNPNAIQSLYGNEYTLRDTASGFYGRHNLFLDLIDRFRSGHLGALEASMMAYTSNGVSLAEILYEKNYIDVALGLLPEYVDAALQEENFKTYLPAMLCLANIQQSKGEFSDALITINACEKILKKNGEYLALQTLGAYKVRFDILVSNNEGIKSWEKEIRINAHDDVSNISRYSLYLYLTLLVMLIKMKRWVLARVLSDKIMRMLMRFPDLVYKSQALFLDSYISYKNNQYEILDKKIDMLLNLGYQEGYFRTFVDFGYPFLEFISYIKETRSFGPEITEYISMLFEASLDFTMKIRAEENSIENLTGREHAVLELLAQGLSNQEIAEAMYISLQTVKNHTRSIYKKLNVAGRSQAKNKADKLGLLNTFQ